MDGTKGNWPHDSDPDECNPFNGFFLSIMALPAQQFIDFLREWPTVQAKFVQSFHELSLFMIDSLGISLLQQEQWLTQITDQTAGAAFALVRRTISFSAVSFVIFFP